MTVDPLAVDTLAVDALTQALDSLRISTTLYAMARLVEPWGVGFPTADGAYFHVAHGPTCWLTVGPPQLGSAAFPLTDGDVVLLPHGSAHHLTARPDGEAGVVFDPRTWTPNRLTPLPDGRAGPSTELVCGAVKVHRPRSHPVLAGLPPVVLVRSGSPGADELLLTSSVLRAEARLDRPGIDIVMARLGDVMLVQILRIWAAQQPSADSGWLAALRDPAVGAAITAMHADPGAAWTVEALARVAGLSRSRFAERFVELVGRPPQAYLADWRMTRAGQLLSQPGATIREVGRRVGFGSEPAFSRAFTRHHGIAPSRFRVAERKHAVRD